MSTLQSSVGFSSNGHRKPAYQKDLSRVRPRPLSEASPAKNGNAATTLPCLPTIVDERVRKVLEIIESGQPCSIHDLAHQFDLTHFHLLHLFKQQVGIPLGQALTEQRLCGAARLLAQGHFCIKEIAYAAGYEHTSSFARAFQRRFGISPRRYREQSRSQEKLRNSA